MTRAVLVAARRSIVAPRGGALAALSQVFVDGQSLRTYRHAPNTGSRKSWAAGDACSRAVRLALIAQAGEMGYPGALTAPARTVPLAGGIRHCVVIGTVPSKRDGLVAGWVGDLLVRPADAQVAASRGEVDPRDIRVVGGARHLDLLNHPAVYVHLSEWLAFAA